MWLSLIQPFLKSSPIWLLWVLVTLQVAADEGEPNKDALRCYLGQSDLVVVGELLSDNARFGRPEEFKVADAIKGDPGEKIIRVANERGWPGPNVEFPEGEMVLFLWKRQAHRSTNWETFWRPRDVKFGAMPATPGLVQSLKKLAVAQTTKSGEEQLGVLLRRFAPNCTLREVNYTIGNQPCSTVALWGWGEALLDRREMKWIAVSNQPQENITYMHCRKVPGLMYSESNIQTAKDAEDYVKMLFGLCAGPCALEYWTVKAERVGGRWLVKLTYAGPAAEVRAVGPMELVCPGAGHVIDVVEWRPNFKPGRTAKVMRPIGMNPDGFDPAPAELDDPTLDYYLSRCEMVVVGRMMHDVSGFFGKMWALKFINNFEVIEVIKGQAARGSRIAVTVTQRDLVLWKKGQEFILFLNNKGGFQRSQTNSGIWRTIWDTDDIDFGALPSSPQIVSALKRLAVEHGPALETPNLYWGAEVEGISVRLESMGWVWKHGQDFTVSARVSNHSSNNFFLAQNQEGGELEVDGVWYVWPHPAKVFDLALDANRHSSVEIPIIVGQAWRRKVEGIERPEQGAPLNLAVGKHKIRFAVRVRRNGSEPGSGVIPEIRAVSNPLEVEIREDTRLRPRRGAVPPPIRAPEISPIPPLL